MKNTDIETGTYEPVWETVSGFTMESDVPMSCQFTRVGNLVKVICNLGRQEFGRGTNKSTISVPAHLPIENRMVSGQYASDHYRNNGDPAIGIVANSLAGKDKVLLQVNDSPLGIASSWCSFTYFTS